LLATKLNLTENYKLSECNIARLERFQGCNLARLKGLKGWMQTFKLGRIERIDRCKLEAYASQLDGP